MSEKVKESLMEFVACTQVYLIFACFWSHTAGLVFGLTYSAIRIIVVRDHY